MTTQDKEATITQLFKDVERLVNQEEYTKALRSLDKSNNNYFRLILIN